MYNVYQDMYLKERKVDEIKLKQRELQLSKERNANINQLANKYERKVKGFVNEVSTRI